MLAKGAPEAMEALFDPALLPANYSECYRQHSLLGGRVLALGARQLPAATTWDSARAMTRADTEQKLRFCGFLVGAARHVPRALNYIVSMRSWHDALDGITRALVPLQVLKCPIKSKSRSSIKALQESSHRIVVITGDHMLTTLFVARELKIMKRKQKILLLTADKDGGFASLRWETVAGKEKVRLLPQGTSERGGLREWRCSGNTLRVRYSRYSSWQISKPLELGLSADMLTKLCKEFCLCIGGPELQLLQTHAASQATAGNSAGEAEVRKLLGRIMIFARTSPVQKEAIVTALKDNGTS